MELLIDPLPIASDISSHSAVYMGIVQLNCHGSGRCELSMMRLSNQGNNGCWHYAHTLISAQQALFPPY